MGITHIRYDGLCPPGMQAGFSLKSFWTAPGNLDRDRFRAGFLNEMGYPGSPVASAGQVHGSRVAAVIGPGHYPETDGLATNQPGLFLTILVADCLPVYLWDERAGCIALIHAGWRGSAAEIAKAGVQVLQSQFGASSEYIGALLGPCICSNCYEVGPEVAKAFQSDDLLSGKNGRPHLDLHAANRRQLIEAGVPAANIIEDRLCTRCRNDLLCSYRAEGPQAGRLIAAMALPKRPSS